MPPLVFTNSPKQSFLRSTRLRLNNPQSNAPKRREEEEIRTVNVDSPRSVSLLRWSTIKRTLPACAFPRDPTTTLPTLDATCLLSLVPLKCKLPTPSQTSCPSSPWVQPARTRSVCHPPNYTILLRRSLRAQSHAAISILKSSSDIARPFFHSRFKDD